MAFTIPPEEEILSTPFYFGKKAVTFTPKGWQLCFAPEYQLALTGGYGCFSKSLTLNGINACDLTQESEVRTLFGPAQASPVYRKGVADLYRVRVANGSQVSVTADHRFLTPDGWRRLGSLHAGSLIAVDDMPHDLTRRGKSQDLLADYPYYFHSDDGLPTPSEVAFQSLAERLYAHDNQQPCTERIDHVSIEDCSWTSVHASEPLHRDDEAVAGRVHGQYQPPLRSHDNSYRKHTAGQSGQFDGAFSRRYPCHDGSRTVLRHGRQLSDLFQSSLRSQQMSGLVLEDQRFVLQSEDSFVQASWDRIVDISWDYKGDFYDISVPGMEHYSAHGLWHHNSSKTHPSICRATRLATWFPGNLGLLGRFASTDLAGTTRHDALEFWREANLLEEFKEKHPEYKVPTATLRCVDPHTQEVLKNKYSEVIFVHLDDPEHIHGYHLGFGGIDEANQCKKAAWDKLASRLRRPGFEGTYSMWATSNTDKGYDWIYDYFFNPEELERLRLKKPESLAKRRGIIATTYENRRNLPKDYIENMEATYSPRMCKVLLEASYDTFEGQMYEDWSEEVHVIPLRKYFPAGIPENWNRLLAVDPGGADPWAFIWAAVDPWGNVIVYDEIYEKGSKVKPFAEAAMPKMMRKSDGKPLRFQAKVIDSENKIAAGELSEYGLHFTNAQKSNKMGDLNSSYYRLCGYMHPNPAHAFPDWHIDKKGKAGSPRFFVADTCKMTRKEIPQQRWKQIRGESRLTNEPDESVENHAVDCCLYMIRELPKPTELEKTIISNLSPDLSKQGRIMNFIRRNAAEQDRRMKFNARMGHGGRHAGRRIHLVS